MRWLIRYTDGSYEHTQGSGFPCGKEEARRFDYLEDAQIHAEMLVDVDCFEEEVECSDK